MNAPFEGIVFRLLYGPHRWFLMFNLAKDCTDKIVNALNQVGSDSLEVSAVFDDFGIYENAYPDALLLPDQAWKLLTDPVVTPLLEGRSTSSLARFSEDQMKILTAVALPMHELHVVLRDAYALKFTIEFFEDTEYLETESLSPKMFEKINRLGCADLDHGTDLYEHFRSIDIDDDDEDDEDEDNEDDYSNCEYCGELVHDNSLTRGYCEDCCSYCEDCGDLTPDNELTDGYCESCIDHCVDCGQSTPSQLLNDDHRCDSCAENYSECAECGELYHNDELNDRDMCEGCAQNQIDRVGG